MIARVVTLLRDVHESCVLSNCGLVPRLIGHGRRGRPFYDIRSEQLKYLLQIRFSCPQIAKFIGVSMSTIRRRMTYYGLSVQSLYSSITDDELDMVVSEISGHFPNCGYRMMECNCRHLLCKSCMILRPVSTE